MPYLKQKKTFWISQTDNRVEDVRWYGYGRWCLWMWFVRPISKWLVVVYCYDWAWMPPFHLWWRTNARPTVDNTYGKCLAPYSELIIKDTETHVLLNRGKGYSNEVCWRAKPSRLICHFVTKNCIPKNYLRLNDNSKHTPHHNFKGTQINSYITTIPNPK